MTDRELMQQALDAFESGRAADRAEAMTALRAALVTTPRREWVGLTDEEMKQTCYETFSFDPYVIARAIEAALKEKNA